MRKPFFFQATHVPASGEPDEEIFINRDLVQFAVQATDRAGDVTILYFAGESVGLSIRGRLRDVQVLLNASE